MNNNTSGGKLQFGRLCSGVTFAMLICIGQPVSAQYEVVVAAATKEGIEIVSAAVAKLGIDLKELLGIDVDLQLTVDASANKLNLALAGQPFEFLASGYSDTFSGKVTTATAGGGGTVDWWTYQVVLTLTDDQQVTNDEESDIVSTSGSVIHTIRDGGVQGDSLEWSLQTKAIDDTDGDGTLVGMQAERMGDHGTSLDKLRDVGISSTVRHSVNTLLDDQHEFTTYVFSATAVHLPKPPSNIPGTSGMKQLFYRGRSSNREEAEQLFASAEPVAPEFVANHGSSWWFDHQIEGGELDGLEECAGSGLCPPYPSAISPELGAGSLLPVEENLSHSDYTVRGTGFINIPESGTYRFADGVDDYTFLAVDVDGSGIAGDRDEEVIIDDNNPIDVDFDGIRLNDAAGFPEDELGSVEQSAIPDLWIPNEFLWSGPFDALAAGDCNGDGVVDADDLVCGNAAGVTESILAQLGLIEGDLDADGSVGFADFLVLSANFGARTGAYTEGDIDASGDVGFPDFLILSANFGQMGGGDAAAVSEPSSVALFGLGTLLAGLVRRRRR